MAATIAITGDINYDTIGDTNGTGYTTTGSKTGNDTHNINGGKLTVDTDTRYCNNHTATTGNLGTVTIDSLLGGTLLLDGTKVFLIPFDGGTGTSNVPAVGATVTGATSGATGYVLGVWTDLKTRSAATDMNGLTGYIKVRSPSATAFQDNEDLNVSGSKIAVVNYLTGGTLPAGWIEVVGIEGSLLTVPRKGTWQITGAWFYPVDAAGAKVLTSGSRNQQQQLPGSLGGTSANTYLSGVFIERSYTQLTVDGASNASPIRISTTTPHYLRTGDKVTVASVGGNTAANATANAVTVISPTEFTLDGTTGNGDYTSGGTADYVSAGRDEDYEFYPNAGTAMLIGTEQERGKVCWISKDGLLTIGHDGTQNAGYLPPAGLKIRLGNVLCVSATSAAMTANAQPHTTPSSRYRLANANYGAVDWSKACVNWYLYCSYLYSLSVVDSAVYELAYLSNIYTQIVFTRMGFGSSVAGTNPTVACTLGGTSVGMLATDCVFFKRLVDGTTNTPLYVNNSSNSNFVRCVFSSGVTRTSQGPAVSVLASNNTVFEACFFVGGGINISNSNYIEVINCNYVDRVSGATINAVAVDAVYLANSTYCKVEGMFFPIVTATPYNYLINLYGAKHCKFRSIGTAAKPVALGNGTPVVATATRSSTTLTVTSNGHGLITNQPILVTNINSDSGTVNPATSILTPPNLYLVTYVDENTFTITVANGGATSGIALTYYTGCRAYLANIANGYSSLDCEFKSIFFKNSIAITGFFPQDSSASDLLFENVGVVDVQLAMINGYYAGSNVKFRALRGLPYRNYLSALGMHWVEFFCGDNAPAATSVNWTRSSTVVTVTDAAGHRQNYNNGHFPVVIIVTASSDEAAIPLGPYAISNVLSADSFKFTGLNAGGSSGTLSFKVATGGIALLLNPPSVSTTDQCAITNGTPTWNGIGALYAPSVDDEVTWTMTLLRQGHAEFLPVEVNFQGSATLSNYKLLYQIDKNDSNGFGGRDASGVWAADTWANLYYERTGCSGSAAQPVISMTSVTGLAVGDYVFGTGIPGLTKIQSINTGANQITLDKNILTGGAGATLRFNGLPSETIDAEDGFKLKVKLRTVTANSGYGIGPIRVAMTNSSDAQMDAVSYPLDTATLAVSGIVAGSRLKVTKVSDGTVLANEEVSGTTWTKTDFEYEGLVNVEIRKASASPYYKAWTGQATLDNDTAAAVVALQERDDQ
jgi:hypothetical protein